MKDAKESCPGEVAEYAIKAGINDEPVFRWWVYTIRKKQVMAAVKQRYVKKSQKFGIRVPHSVEEAYTLDRENSMWIKVSGKRYSQPLAGLYGPFMLFTVQGRP